MTDGDGRVFARRHRKSWREIFSRTCRPSLSLVESAPLKEAEVARMYWSRKAESSAAIFLLFSFRPRFCQNNCFSPPLSTSIFFGTRSISFLFVRAADGQSASGFDIKKVSLPPLSPRPIYPWRRRTHSYCSLCRLH